MQFGNQNDTICALSTAPGIGALSVIRVTGKKAFSVVGNIFSKSLKDAAAHTVHFGRISLNGRLIDEVVVAVFRGPHSFTGEDIIEISCHGSPYIVQEIIHELLAQGCRLAEPGEFSMRAFMNGKVDLSQAEAIADLIASSSAAAHKLAMNQMRGGFSKKINALRERLIHFASLIELELDFSEEDVEFADRKDLTLLVEGIQGILAELIASFATGQAIKNGIPVAIIGAPNMGKSTLLNALLDEERAIVSEIAGTTRDTIEDEMTIDGVQFRFIDTAGIRDTTDVVESMGITRALEKAGKASVILFMTDALESSADELSAAIQSLEARIGSNALLIPIGNKVDKARDITELEKKFESIENMVLLSAAEGHGMDALRTKLTGIAAALQNEGSDSIVSNIRHYEALTKAHTALNAVLEGISKNITGDFLAVDIRKSLHHLGEITGVITTDDLLGNIFSKFCIGK
jgi:tRNA modification GTPase